MSGSGAEIRAGLVSGLKYLPARKPSIEVHGPVAMHDQSCAVFHSPQPFDAVLDLNTGVFQPSWEAQAAGWHLVQATTWVQRTALRCLFGVKP